MDLMDIGESEKKTTTTTLTFTEKAAAKAREVLEEKGMPEGALRVFVVGGGCSGYSYGMAMAQEPEPGDLVVESLGIKIVVDPESAPMLQGVEIDYADDLMKAGFTIHNPNAVKSCACGTSFQTAEDRGQAQPCSH